MMTGASGMARRAPNFCTRHDPSPTSWGRKWALWLRAQLLPQHLRWHLLDRAWCQATDLERTVGDADQARDRPAQMLADAADLAVLALGQTHGEPGVVALPALECRAHRPVVGPVDGDAVGQIGKRRQGDRATRAYAIAPRPAGRRQFEPALQLAVVGEQQQPFGIEIEPPDRNHARQLFRQAVEHRRPALRIA